MTSDERDVMNVPFVVSQNMAAILVADAADGQDGDANETAVRPSFKLFSVLSCEKCGEVNLGTYCLSIAFTCNAMDEIQTHLDKHDK